jgi:hypothetical protein
MTPAKRKVGRPRSNKRQFCIRMTPEAHALLTKASKNAGSQRLSDWLEALAFGNVTQPAPDLSEMTPTQIGQAFRVGCDQAAKALLNVLEVVDHEPAVGEHDLRAFGSVKETYREMVCLARSVGIGN